MATWQLLHNIDTQYRHRLLLRSDGPGLTKEQIEKYVREQAEEERVTTYQQVSPPDAKSDEELVRQGLADGSDYDAKVFPVLKSEMEADRTRKTITLTWTILMFLSVTVLASAQRSTSVDDPLQKIGVTVKNNRLVFTTRADYERAINESKPDVRTPEDAQGLHLSSRDSARRRKAGRRKAISIGPYHRRPVPINLEPGPRDPNR
jgi:hypothetical protein